ncbi:MAG: ATP-binding protein [Nonlabens sp.]|nr:ATP-binding protein [Nonlabens sp.]
MTGQQENLQVSKASQQIAVDRLLRDAREASFSGKYQEAYSIINSAREIAQDSTIYADTQIAYAQYLILSDNPVKARNILASTQSLVLQNSNSYVKKGLLNVELLILEKKYTVANEELNNLNASIYALRDAEIATTSQFLRAQLFKASGNNKEALQLYNKVLPDLRTNKLFFYEAQAQLARSSLLLDSGQIESAETSIDSAVTISKKYHYSSLELDGISLLKDLSVKKGNFEKAFIYTNRYNELLREKAKLTSTPVEKSEYEAVIAAQKTEILELQSSLRGRETSSLLLFVMLTLLGLLTLSLFKNNKLRAKSNTRLELNNISLTEERDRAQDAAKIKADFLSTITHELRTPMYAVTGLTHLLLESNPKSDQIDHLQTLQSSGEYLLSLIDNILDFNKLEANKVALESIPFDLQKRIKDLTVSLIGQANDRNNELHLEFDRHIPSRILGDPIKISQIVINLISNAIKFTESGDIWIRINASKKIDDRQLIRFEIEDNGKGISPEKQALIFDNFEQEEASTSREYGGTGLGLAIVKNLVQLMGGDVHLDSKLGRGSLFSFEIWFEIPDSNKFVSNHMATNFNSKDSTTKNVTPAIEQTRQLARKQSELAPIETSLDSEETTAKQGDLENQKNKEKLILIVEDNKINQMITRKILEGKSFKCEVANDGLEALAMVSKKNYDLVLMDIHMPNMNGKDATAKIRAFNQEIPIIALTAVTLNETEKEFYELGFDDIIPKPFKMDIFFDKIKKALGTIEIN